MCVLFSQIDLMMLTSLFVCIPLPLFTRQRKVCSPAGLLPCHLTAHLLRVRITSLKFKDKSNLRYISYYLSTSSWEKIKRVICRLCFLCRVCYVPAYDVDAQGKKSTEPGPRSVYAVLCCWSPQWYCLFSLQLIHLIHYLQAAHLASTSVRMRVK